jgi:hypothetical protein
VEGRGAVGGDEGEQEFVCYEGGVGGEGGRLYPGAQFGECLFVGVGK